MALNGIWWDLARASTRASRAQSGSLGSDGKYNIGSGIYTYIE